MLADATNKLPPETKRNWRKIDMYKDGIKKIDDIWDEL